MRRAADRPPSPARRWAGWALTAAAIVVVWVAAVLPDRPGVPVPTDLLRIPLEGVLIAAALLLLPGHIARVAAVVLGLLLAVLTLLKVLDIGVESNLQRPFDPLTDPGLAGAAVGVLADSVGPVGSVLIVVGAVVAVLAGMLVVVLAVRRLGRGVRGHRRGAAWTLAALTAVWGVTALTGVQLRPGLPFASADESAFAAQEAARTAASVGAAQTFTAAVARADPYAKTDPASQLAKLRGKDVLLVFVESYGRVAVQGSSFAPAVDRTLDAGTGTLAAAGFGARTGWLTSPTFGGISWLAHSTLQSGIWVPNQQLYDRLLASDRLTLSAEFARAGWRTVSDAPSDQHPWPQGQRFYRFDRLYDARNVGYAGPRFSYATMPDQFTLQRFRQLELGPGHRPVMAEIDLVSSHTPWTPLPRLVPASDVGDGSVYRPMPAEGVPPSIAWQHPSQVQALYGRSIQYSVQSVVDFVASSHDKNLVVLMLGDHQPAETVSGPHADHDVPMSVIAADPAVLAATDGWGWSSGLRPAPAGPVWRMDRFRNRFFDAFSR